MPTVNLPINFGANKDVEEIGLQTHSAALVNLYADSAGNVMRTPGLVEFCNLGVPYGVDGLYWWDRQSKAIVQCGGRHFQITNANGDYEEIDGDTAQIGKKVYYADFGSSLYAANGGRIIKIPASGDAAYIADADAPTAVSHIAVLDKYLLALPVGLERVEYSEVLNPDSWVGDWVTPESIPDLTKAIGVGNDRIEMVGTHSLEGWRNDGITPFVKDSAYTVDKGITAPHSFVFIEGTWYWLDNERKVVRLSGRQPEVISITLNKYIQEFEYAGDAIGWKMTVDGRPQYVLSFPMANTTICFDVYSGMWFELGRWVAEYASYERFIGSSFCMASAWNLSLLGDRTTGKIYKLDSKTYQDDTRTLRAMLRTPWVHHGAAEQWKKSIELTFYLKSVSASNPLLPAKLMIRWRDNGSTSWRNERTIDVGRVGRSDFHYSIRSLGRYKSRQYEISMSDNAPLVLVSVRESFEVL